jgi:RND family efflux transporter MFP subunit
MAAVLPSGCQRAQSSDAPSGPKALPVKVGAPLSSSVTDFEEFPGKIDAIKTVEIRARVTGYLDKVLFTEGAEVKEGDPLFIIDPRTYRADFDRATANLREAKVHLTRLEADYKRAQTLLPSRAIAQEDFDKIEGDRNEAAAAVSVAEATLATARLNLDFTTVHAPISGRISRQLIDPGNLVRADETPLTMLVSQDPIYCYFDVDERTTLRVRRLIETGRVKSARDTSVKVLLQLADEEGDTFPHEGVVNFIDNRLVAETGTLRFRARFDNSKRLLSPGMFARVRIPVGDPHPSILVSERAFGSNQGQKFLYVVNGKGEVEYRHVTVGALRDGLRVVESGLKLKEKVIMSGLQLVKEGMAVTPTDVAMTGQEPSEPGPLGATRDSPASEERSTPAKSPAAASSASAGPAPKMKGELHEAHAPMATASPVSTSASAAGSRQ